MFPILSAAPPPGEEDPEDEENDTEGDSENPKHFAVQVGRFACFISLTHSPYTSGFQLVWPWDPYFPIFFCFVSINDVFGISKNANLILLL